MACVTDHVSRRVMSCGDAEEFLRWAQLLVFFTSDPPMGVPLITNVPWICISMDAQHKPEYSV